MSSSVRRWMIVCVVAATTMAMVGPASAQIGPTATAASAYGAKVKRVLDRYARDTKPVNTQTAAIFRHDGLAASRVAAQAARSLGYISAPHRWHARHVRAARALRQLAATFRGMVDQVRPNMSPAATNSVVNRNTAQLIRVHNAADAAVLALSAAK